MATVSENRPLKVSLHTTAGFTVWQLDDVILPMMEASGGVGGGATHSSYGYGSYTYRNKSPYYVAYGTNISC